MLEKISGKVVDWQVKRGILSQEERSVYRYAYELFLNQTINVGIAVLIAFLSGTPVAVALFLLSYIPLRSFCGGYHADTNMGCTIVSALLIIAACFLYIYVREGSVLRGYPLLFLVSGYCIMRYAPVQDRNKPLDGAERERYGRMSRILWGIEAAIGILCYAFFPRYGLIIAFIHLVMAIVLGLGIWKNARE